MGAKPQTIERGSQATPFAEDFLAMLQGQLSQGAAGQGVGPAQRQATDHLSSLLTSLADGTDLSNLVGAVETTGRRGINEQALDLRESMGAQGARFGSQLAQSEGRMRREGQQDLTQILAEIMEGGRRFDTQAQLSGAGALHQMGSSNLAPFMQMAQMGILPEEIFMQENPWMQLAGAGLTGAGAFFGGPGGAIAMEKLFDRFGGGGG